MKRLVLALSLASALAVTAAPAPVNVNTSTAKELAAVPGIGKVLAERIIAARPYATLDEVATKVKGIGLKRLEAIRPFLYVECDTDTDCEAKNGLLDGEK